MKKTLLLTILALVTFVTISQVAPNKYLIRFTDKNDSPYSVNAPEEFLSERAMNRRINQGIEIEENDLPVNPDYIAAVAETGVTMLNQSKWFNSVTIYTTDNSALETIENLPFVQSVEKNSYKTQKVVPNGEKAFFANETISALPETAYLKSSTSGLLYEYGEAFNQIDMLNGVALHDLGYAGEGMVIAILDAGFTNTDIIEAFDYLWDNDRILGYRDFVAPHNPDIFGSHSHGTSVLSTMGANLPGEMIGTAPEASYYLCRTEDGASEYLIEELNWVSGAEYADSLGADVINSSLGYTEFDDPSMDHEYEDLNGMTAWVTLGADIAASKGVLVVNSAGNSGGDAWQYINTPSDGFNVFSIGAVTSSGSYASFSSTGPTADGRIKPNVTAQGQSATVISASSGNVSSSSGTSFSSPITAGMVACLWQAHPAKNNLEVMAAIEQSGSKADNPDNLRGHGIPDYLLAHELLNDTDVSQQVGETFSVSPNPFVNELIIRVAERPGNGLKADLMDVTGKLIFSKEFVSPSMQYQISGFDHLPSGIYFLKLDDGNSKYMQKLVK